MPCDPAGQTIRPSRATAGHRGSGSSTRGTRGLTVGPAEATASGGPESTTRRTDGVTSSTETTVRTSTGRGLPGRWSPLPGGPPSGRLPADPVTPASVGTGRSTGRPGRPRGNEVDRAGDRGRGPYQESPLL